MVKEELKQKILQALKEQGFTVNPHIRPLSFDKETLRRIQQKARIEQILNHKKFLIRNLDQVKRYCRNGRDINPQRINLELRQVTPGSIEEVIFRWWNLVWWSIPYQRPYGRQMRFLIWDVAHEAPFGLILLQSPILKIGVRDKFLGIPKKELDIWVNRSMHAQRIGALPPYNELLGGKMVALSLICNEIRDIYRKKYISYKTLIKGREIPTDLLFISTTSAFGRSSIYNRLKIDGRQIAISLGYTKGSGTFHIPDSLYFEILEFLRSNGIDISRGYGHGPSKKLKLISKAFRLLDLRDFEFHGIKREFYLFPLVKNLKKVIQEKEKPEYLNYSFYELVKYWKKRWGIPRSERTQKWKDFHIEEFFRNVKYMLGVS